MKNIITIILLAFSISSFSQTKSDDILGQWMSPKKDSKVQIFKTGTKYYGKIVWGTGGSTKDDKNPDKSLRNRDIIGLIILSGFTFDGNNKWEDGTIYDPREGKTYSCILSLKSATQLNMRGYFGISLFGRTEIWTKVNN